MRVTDEPTVLFGVGATKAGTSWLHSYLGTHPDCAFSTIKELHYFDINTEQQVKRYLKGARADVALLRDRHAKSHGTQQLRLERRIHDLQRWIEVLEQDPLHGDLKPYLGFVRGSAASHQVVGDITPAYALLPADRLRQMANIAGNVRFVYLLRDPVSRLWSHVRMMAVRQGKPEEVAAAAYELFDLAISDANDDRVKGMLARGDYKSCVARLRSAVSADKLFVGYMEDVITPAGVTSLCRFLGISDKPAEVDRRVHEGVHIPLDGRRRALAREALRVQYEFANQNFFPLPAAWRSESGEVAA